MQVRASSAASCFWFPPYLRKDFDSILAQRRRVCISCVTEKWKRRFSLESHHVALWPGKLQVKLRGSFCNDTIWKHNSSSASLHRGFVLLSAFAAKHESQYHKYSLIALIDGSFKELRLNFLLTGVIYGTIHFNHLGANSTGSHWCCSPTRKRQIACKTGSPSLGASSIWTRCFWPGVLLQPCLQETLPRFVFPIKQQASLTSADQLDAEGI